MSWRNLWGLLDGGSKGSSPKSNRVLYVYRISGGGGGVYVATVNGNEDVAIETGGDKEKGLGKRVYELKPPGVKEVINFGVAPSSIQKRVKERYPEAVGLRLAEFGDLKDAMRARIPKPEKPVVEKPEVDRSVGGYTPTPPKRK